jgi:hypothetical protein
MRPGGRVAVIVVPPLDCLLGQKGKPPALVHGRFDIFFSVAQKMKKVAPQIK